MNHCDFKRTGKKEGWYIHECQTCHLRHRSTYADPEMIHRECQEKAGKMAPAQRSQYLPECRHLGHVTDESHRCGGCGGGYRALFSCQIHELCLPFLGSRRAKDVVAQDGISCCSVCGDMDPAVS